MISQVVVKKATLKSLDAGELFFLREKIIIIISSLVGVEAKKEF